MWWRCMVGWMGGGEVRPPRAAESKGRQNPWIMNTLNGGGGSFLPSTNFKILWLFLKFVFCVRDGHCDWSPRSSKNITTSLLRCIRNVWHSLSNNTASYHRRSVSSVTPLWKPQTSQGCFTVTPVCDPMTTSCPQVFGSLNGSFKKRNTAYVRTECGDSESLRKLFWYCVRKKHTPAWQLHRLARSSQKSCLSVDLFVSFIPIILSYFCKLLVCFLFCLMVLQRL